MNLSLVLFLLLSPQQPPPPPNPGDDRPLYGGVPSGPPTAEVLDLTLPGAIERGLQRNLGLLLGEQRVRAAQGARWEALSELLPHLSFRLSETRQKVNLEAFGFTGIVGFPDVPSLVGPFNVFDVRVQVTDTVFAFGSYEKVRAERARIEAARLGLQDVRDLVVLASANLYMRAVAEESRIDAARAQLETARALHELAQDRKKAGLVPSLTSCARR